MPGLRTDQLALYKKDMYKAEREGREQVSPKRQLAYMIKETASGAGDKVSQILGAQELTRHTTEGQSINYESPSNGWEWYVKYHTYSAGIALTYEAVEDTVKLGNLLNELAASWGEQNERAKEKLAARPFNVGGTLSGDYVFNGTHTGNTDPSGALSYTGKPIFALSGNNHTEKDGSTYYNSVASIGEINASNFETIYQLAVVTNAVDERGNEIENSIDTIIVKSGVSRFRAEQLFMTPPSQGMPNSQVNDINPYYGIVKNIIDWRYLNDTADVFYVGKAKSRKWQFHERQKPRLRFFRDEDTAGYKASNMLRIGVLIMDWRTWHRAGGSSAA